MELTLEKILNDCRVVKPSIDWAAHAVFNGVLAFSELQGLCRNKTSVLCKGCDKPVTAVYHEDRLYSVCCPRCKTVALVEAENPEQAARKIHN